MKHGKVEIEGNGKSLTTLTTVTARRPSNPKTNAKGDLFMDNDGETLEADGPLFFP